MLNEIIRQEKCPAYLLHLGGDLKSLAQPFGDTASNLKTFPGIGGKNPTEIVAGVDKAALRLLVLSEMKKRFFQLNLPYMRLAYYPAGFRSVCAFRVDCDITERDSFFSLVRLADKHGLPCTWFVVTDIQEPYLKEVSAIAANGHDLQLHCHVHQTYATRAENFANIRRARELMISAGMAPCGFASPYGKWNAELNSALEDSGFAYSSEFAAGYDDFPFYPPLGGRVSTVLQLPIHPICVGSLRKAGLTEAEMVQYFDGIIKAKHAARVPILLYGHPQNELDKYPAAADFMFAALKSLPQVWVTTLTQYSRWWQTRLAAEYRVSLRHGRLDIATANTDARLQLHLETRDGKEAFIPLINCSIPLAAFPRGSFAGRVGRICAGFRGRVQRCLR